MRVAVASLNSPAEGARAALPVVFGYVPIGFAAGIVGAEAGLSPAEIALLSLLVFAGSAQFVFAGLVAAPAPVLVATVFMINLRHLLYSTVLAERIKHLPLSRRLAAGAQLTDETFAVSAVLFRTPPSAAGGLLTLNMVSYTAWFCGNIAGAFTGARAAGGDWGADFLLAAMFAALLMLNIMSEQSARRRRAGAALAAALLIILLESLWPHPLHILTAAGIAAAVGAYCERRAGAA